tara:strand:+ start:2559 stop:2726 length:168 start_codon:yes stop_codon:yes gene_type:complete
LYIKFLSKEINKIKKAFFLDLLFKLMLFFLAYFRNLGKEEISGLLGIYLKKESQE